jgi:hypothetical protein
MSTTDTLVSLRESFERAAATLLYIATAVTVAAGTIAMCITPVAG